MKLLLLFKLGLTVARQPPALAGQKSTDFGVLEGTSDGGRKFRKKPIGTQVSNSSRYWRKRFLLLDYERLARV
jgi:hypothetical protein